MTRATALIADASALVRAYTRQEFDHVADDEVVLRPVGTVLRLPQRPVTAVVKVEALGGGVVPDLTLPVGTWAWDGADKVDIWPPETSVWLTLPERWSDVGWPVGAYRVTYSHGHASPPPEVVAVVCGMALRVLLSPSMVEGLVSERIGQYNYQMQQGTGTRLRPCRCGHDPCASAAAHGDRGTAGGVDRLSRQHRAGLRGRGDPHTGQSLATARPPQRAAGGRPRPARTAVVARHQPSR